MGGNAASAPCNAVPIACSGAKGPVKAGKAGYHGLMRSRCLRPMTLLRGRTPRASRQSRPRWTSPRARSRCRWPKEFPPIRHFGRPRARETPAPECGTRSATTRRAVQDHHRDVVVPRVGVGAPRALGGFRELWPDSRIVERPYKALLAVVRPKNRSPWRTVPSFELVGSRGLPKVPYGNLASSSPCRRFGRRTRQRRFRNAPSRRQHGDPRVEIHCIAIVGHHNGGTQSAGSIQAKRRPRTAAVPLKLHFLKIHRAINPVFVVHHVHHGIDAPPRAIVCRSAIQRRDRVSRPCT